MVEIKKHASKQKFNLKQNSVTFLSPNEEIYTEEIDKKSKNKNKGTTFEDALKKEIASSIKSFLILCICTDPSSYVTFGWYN